MGWVWAQTGHSPVNLYGNTATFTERLYVGRSPAPCPDIPGSRGIELDAASFGNVVQSNHGEGGVTDVSVPGPTTTGRTTTSRPVRFHPAPDPWAGKAPVVAGPILDRARLRRPYWNARCRHAVKLAWLSRYRREAREATEGLVLQPTADPSRPGGAGVGTSTEGSRQAPALSAAARISVVGFIACSTILWPYSFSALYIERQMFSGVVLVPPLLTFGAIILYYFVGARPWPSPRTTEGPRSAF